MTTGHRMAARAAGQRPGRGVPRPQRQRRHGPLRGPRLDPQDRVEDLLGRLSLEEKVGLMFQTVIEAGADGSLIEQAGEISKSPTSVVVLRQAPLALQRPRAGGPAAWRPGGTTRSRRSPRPRRTASRSRSRPTRGTRSWRTPVSPSRPRPSRSGRSPRARRPARHRGRVGSSRTSPRQEYVAVGIRAALHPTLDLATEPRWGRQAGTFGQDPDLVTELGDRLPQGFPGDSLGSGAWPARASTSRAADPQKDGEDAHFPYGREQVYPGGRFADHLKPFPPVIEAGTAAIMPYYGMPIDLVVDGEPIEQVGFGYNKQVVTGLLRGKLGYDGVVVTDWELVNDNHVGDQVLPARAWGVEHLDPPGRMELILEAGADQFGGEECVEILLDLVAEGRVTEARIDESARRLLAVKFRLGLFDDPYVDEDAAADGRAGRLPGAGVRCAGAVGHGADEPRRRAAARDRPADLRRAGLGRRAGAARQLGRSARGRRRGPRAAHGALRAAVRPLPGGVVPPGLPRLPAGPRAPSRPGRSDVPARRRRRARPAGRALPLLDSAAAVVGSFGSSDDALLDALTGRIAPRGRLPFDLPRSMEQVRRHHEDVPGYDDPCCPSGTGCRSRQAPARASPPAPPVPVRAPAARRPGLRRQPR